MGRCLLEEKADSLHDLQGGVVDQKQVARASPNSNPLQFERGFKPPMLSGRPLVISALWLFLQIEGPYCGCP